MLSSGSLYCWGQGEYVYGDNSRTVDELRPVQVATDAVYVAAGHSFTCAAFSVRPFLRCWGSLELGMDRRSALELDARQTGTAVSALQVASTPTDVCAGRDFGCSVFEDGTVACWGKGSDGQLGNGENADATDPVQVLLAPGAQARAVTCGRSHACALLTTSGT